MGLFPEGTVEFVFISNLVNNALVPNSVRPQSE